MTTPTDLQSRPAPRPSAWRRGALAIGLVAGGFVLGAGTLASASGDMPWHRPYHHGPRIGAIQRIVHRALDGVGATTAQEDKIHDIVASTYTELQKDKDGHEALRKQVFDLMRAPTIDRAAVEKLRAEKVAAFDVKSKEIVGAVLDAAQQLTPDQRMKLAQRIEDRIAAHRGWGGWRRHDEHGGSDHGAEDGEDHG